MFITATEWKEVFGGKKAGSQAHKEFKQLSFDCCALTFQPFENPVCTKQGIVYDLLSIVPYIKKHGIDPASGEKLAIKDLVRLTFHK
jgi:peptidyl-prolyl cis-trans isomerase-like protein 2